MKSFNVFTMVLFSYLLLFLYAITFAIIFLIGSVTSVFFWANKKLALSLVWFEMEILKEKGIEFDVEQYKSAIEDINNVDKID